MALEICSTFIVLQACKKLAHLYAEKSVLLQEFFRLTLRDGDGLTFFQAMTIVCVLHVFQRFENDALFLLISIEAGCDLSVIYHTSTLYYLILK